MYVWRYYFREIDNNKTRVSMAMKVIMKGWWVVLFTAIIQIGDFIMATRQLSKIKELPKKIIMLDDQY